MTTVKAKVRVPKLDVKRILRVFGETNADVYSAVSAGGVELSFQAVTKWRERNALSMERWLQLVAIARAQGRNLEPIENYYLWD